jgi:1-aminocyclopropane-1-carboxylate deaminase
MDRAGIRLLVLREDLNHPEVSGNKWWKLKYNLQEALQLNQRTLLTFGGAYSNHIFSTAAAAHELGLKSIGVIRGEETVHLNHTLAFAKEKGMLLHFVSREAYRQKTEMDFIHNLKNLFGDFFLIPEGGTNAMAIKGCSEFAREFLSEISFDYLCLPVGTGGTMAGIVNGLPAKRQVIGFSALKGSEFLDGVVSRLTDERTNWKIIHTYHFGGYAKTTGEQLGFIEKIEKQFNLTLDAVYTSKMMMGIFDLAKKNFFKRGSTVLMLHTGGLQGK